MSDIEIKKAVKPTSSSRSRSRSRSQRPNYKIDDGGLNKSDEDEEYKEEEEEEEEGDKKLRNGRKTTDNEEDYMEEEEEENLPRRRSKRTRSTIRKEEESEELKEKEQENDNKTVKTETTKSNDDDNDNEKENDSDVETPKDKTVSDEKTDNQDNEDSHLNKKAKLSYPVDSDGHPLPVVNDEYALPDDPSGEEKIDTDGNLKGGRKFKVRSFKLFDNGDRLFMLATEPARAVGLRDSATLFQHHPNLYKYILSQSEKNKLIGQSVLPYSYRNRTISVVAARSIFKEFGHQIIVNGKENDDDYYSDPNLRHNIVKEGQIPRDKQSHRGKRGKHAKYKHGKSSSSSSHNNNNITTDTTGKHRHTEGQERMDQAQLQSSTDPAKNTIDFFQNNQSHSTNINNASVVTNIASSNGIITNSTIDMSINSNYNALFNVNGNQLNATNWLYQHAAVCSRYNSDIYYDRVRILLIENQGIRDPYTNTLHVPQGTQPTKVIGYQKVDSLKERNDALDNKEVQYEVLIKDRDLLRPVTGLSKIPKEIYEDVVDKTTLEAIEQQKIFEEGL